jgi:hypothetical protein
MNFDQLLDRNRHRNSPGEYNQLLMELMLRLNLEIHHRLIRHLQQQPMDFHHNHRHWQ